MLTATFIRHAKSNWEFDFIKDIDRPLNKRGYKEAYELAKKLGEQMYYPDLIISSPATRAISTALIIAKEIKYDLSKIEIEPALYESNIAQIFNLLKKLPLVKKHVFLFGHNPSFTDSVNLLQNNKTIDSMRTCGLVSIGFNVVDWKLVETGGLIKML
ncbi:MAG: histidine phosphatase family protein [Bacteroidetes bacterium]|nr:histidine phosphatase family protein [Bacteroidota bacterium]